MEVKRCYNCLFLHYPPGEPPICNKGPSEEINGNIIENVKEYGVFPEWCPLPITIWK